MPTNVFFEATGIVQFVAGVTPSSWSEMAKRYEATAEAAAPDAKIDYVVTISPFRKVIWVLWLSLPVPVVGYILQYSAIPRFQVDLSWLLG